MVVDPALSYFDIHLDMTPSLRLSESNPSPEVKSQVSSQGSVELCLTQTLLELGLDTTLTKRCIYFFPLREHEMWEGLWRRRIQPTPSAQASLSGLAASVVKAILRAE